MASLSTPPTTDAALALRFREMAARAGEEAARKRDPAIGHQAPTARRARIADGMMKEAESIERLQRILLSLAQAHEAGTLPPILGHLRTLAAIKTVLSGWYPLLRLAHDDVEHLLRHAAGAPAASRRRVAALNKQRDADGWVPIPEDAMPDVSVLIQVAGPRGESIAHLLEDALKTRKRLREAGINTPEAFAEAKALLDGLGRDPDPKPKKDPTIAALERGLLGTEIPGYFPTPPEVVEQLLDHAAIRRGMRVLEPSAGKGNIADAIAQVEGVRLDVVELAYRLREILELKGHRIVGHDFLAYAQGGYERVVMNPPFEQLQDTDHVRHAYELLAPGGRLVSIVSASAFYHPSRKAVEFRDWLNALGAHHEKLPEGSFAKGERRTSASAYIIVVNKPDN